MKIETYITLQPVKVGDESQAPMLCVRIPYFEQKHREERRPCPTCGRPLPEGGQQ